MHPVRSRYALRPLVAVMVLAVLLPLVHSHALFERDSGLADGNTTQCEACVPNGRLAVLTESVRIALPLIPPACTLSASTPTASIAPLSREMPSRAPPASV